MQSGQLINIRPVCANLMHDVELFGKQDPYCLITLGTQQWKSEISKGGGKTPCWNDEAAFVLQPGVDLIRFALFDDKLIGADKLIAEGVIPLDKILSFSSPFEEKIPLTFKAKPCGFLQIRFTQRQGSLINQPTAMVNQDTKFKNLTEQIPQSNFVNQSIPLGKMVGNQNDHQHSYSGNSQVCNTCHQTTLPNQQYSQGQQQYPQGQQFVSGQSYHQQPAVGTTTTTYSTSTLQNQNLPGQDLLRQAQGYIDESHRTGHGLGGHVNPIDQNLPHH